MLYMQRQQMQQQKQLQQEEEMRKLQERAEHERQLMAARMAAERARQQLLQQQQQQKQRHGDVGDEGSLLDEEVDEFRDRMPPPLQATAGTTPGWSSQLAAGGKLGLSSLLMPPSVRRKLEVAAEETTESSSANTTAEATATYLLLQTTSKGAAASSHLGLASAVDNMSYLCQRRRPLHPDSIWEAEREENVFTARTERPIRDTHLRELYKVEQEMHDMSEALTSFSFSDASTISEVNELEAAS